MNVEPGSRDFMLKEGKRGRGFLPPPDKNQPLRDDVLDKITIDDLDELYTDDGHHSHSGVDVPPGGNGFVGPFGPGGFGGLFGGAFGAALPFHGSPPGFGSSMFGPQNRKVITKFFDCDSTLHLSFFLSKKKFSCTVYLNHTYVCLSINLRSGNELFMKVIFCKKIGTQSTFANL